MIAALQVDDFAYLLLLLVHILAVLVGFGAALTASIVTRRSFGGGTQSRADALSIVDTAGRTLAAPAFIVAGLFGILMVLVGPWEFSESWITIAFVLWIALIANAVLLVDPTSKALVSLAASIAGGESDDEDTLKALRGRLGMSTGIGHLLVLALVVVMVWGSAGQI